MFIDYWKAILKKFEQKKAANELSLRLLDLSPANLRDECVAVCKTRFERNDERTLEAFFFGKKEDVAGYIKAIEKIDIDKFRPVINFIKGNVSNPAHHTVELVAWLIDFRPRPFNDSDIYPEPETIKPPISKPADKPVDDPVYIPPPPVILASETNTRTGFNWKKLVKPAIILCVLIIGAYFISKNIGQKANIQEGCMYWNSDHYEQISCNKKMGDAMIIALDTVKLKYFRKIMKEDTITYNSIGKLWYIKINNKPEYFTARGKHPLYPALILKPITAHIIDTYIKVDSVK